jgi:heptaprenyl diphosphate synthase
VNDISRKKTDILGRINQFIHHSYLKEFIGTPEVDEDKLFLLVTLCNELNVKEEVADSYIITTMLVQVALDIHEQVSIATKSNDNEQKIQQLKVLAGDYYSGLYYKLLAEIEDIHMIKRLAESIKLINEHKIRVYRQDLTYQDSLIDSIKIIEGALLQGIAEAHQLPLWKEITSEILLLKRLYTEKEQFNNNGYSIITSYMIKEFYEQNSKQENSNLDVEKKVQDHLDLVILDTTKRIEKLMGQKEIVHSSILSSLQSMIKRFSSIQCI